jgi:predicted 3-demethylubiquinone-9 3-methyltransferase (glyoxalase superfamily)
MSEISFNGKIQPYIMFNNNAEEAVNTYTSLFPKSSISLKLHWGDNAPFPADKIRFIGFSLCGLNIMASDAGDSFKPSAMMSFFVHCTNQAELDKYFNVLSIDGEEMQCGWVKDKFGIHWQLIPLRFNEMMNDPNPKKVGAVIQAFMQMKKIDIAILEQVYSSI